MYNDLLEGSQTVVSPMCVWDTQTTKPKPVFMIQTFRLRLSEYNQSNPTTKDSIDDWQDQSRKEACVCESSMMQFPNFFVKYFL